MKRTRNGMSYMGSKFKLFPWIYENLPNDIENMKVLDVFGGGGSVTFSLSENYPEIDVTYNDFSTYIYKVVNYINETKTEDIKEDLKGYLRDDNVNMRTEHKGKTKLWFKEKEKFKYIKDNFINIKDPEQKWLYWYLISNIHTGFRQSKTGNHNLSMGANGVNFKRFNKHKNYLNIKTRNNKFQDIDFNDYDFLYLDPPYLNTTKYSKDFNINSELTLLKQLENYKGKFMMSNYMNENIEQWATKNNYKVLEKQHIKSLGGNVTKSTEILIMNY